MSTGMLAEAWMRFFYTTQIVQTRGNLTPVWGLKKYWKTFASFCLTCGFSFTSNHLCLSVFISYVSFLFIQVVEESLVEFQSNVLVCFVASASGKALVVFDETERTMRVTWNAAPGPVVSYRLTYVPQAGGKEMTMKIPANVTTTMLRKLQPLTTYRITVHPIYKRGEGKARQGVGTTRTLANNSKPMSHRSVQTQAYITTYTGKNDVLPQYCTLFLQF